MGKTQTIEEHEWVASALCAGDPPDSLFVRGAAQRQVRNRCLKCPVRLDCLADALQWSCDFGVWGGLTERERRALKRRFPKIEDWWLWLSESEDQLALEIRSNGVPRVLSMVRGGS